MKASLIVTLLLAGCAGAGVDSASGIELQLFDAAGPSGFGIEVRNNDTLGVEILLDDFRIVDATGLATHASSSSTSWHPEGWPVKVVIAPGEKARGVLVFDVAREDVEWPAVLKLSKGDRLLASVVIDGP